MASVELGTGHIPVRPDLRRFGTELESTVGSSLRSAGQKISRAGSTLTRSVTLPVIAGFGFAFKSASDLEESINKVGVVFRDNAPEIQRFAETAAESLGISNQQALEATGTFGNLFRSMEIGLAPATDMSKRIVTLASDLASFNNASPEDTLLALRAGLVGEIEPLRRFGVNLNQVRITEEAVRLGLAKEGEVLSAAAKAQAAFSLILEDTTLAQGDFARTSDGAANKMRIMRAKALDLAAGLGQRLLPIGMKILGFFESLLDRFDGLSPSTQDLIVKGLALAAALGPVLLVVGKLTSGVGLLIGGVGKLSTTFKISSAAAGVWGLAIAAAGVALFKLRGVLNQDDEAAASWSKTIINGETTLQEYRKAVDDVSDGHVNLIDWLDGSAQTMNALKMTTEQVTQAFYKQVAPLIENTEVGARWERQLRDSGAMSIKQKRNLAALIQTTQDYGIKLSDSARVTLESYLATGDYRSALRLLQRQLEGVMGPLKNLLTYTQRQGEAAGDAAQKNQRYAYWLKQVGGAAAGVSNAGSTVPFVPGGAGGQTHAGGITTRFQVRSLHERGSEAILPLEGRAGRALFERIAAAAGGGAGGPLTIQGVLSIDANGQATIRGIARRELEDDHRFAARLARRRAAE